MATDSVKNEEVVATKEQTQPIEADADKSDPSLASPTTLTVNIQQPHGGTSVKMQVSTADTVLDVRQFLADVAETCHITCYNLLFNDEILNEYTELGAVEGLDSDEVTFLMVEDNYDEFSARHHVQHVRSVLVSPPTFAATLGAANVTPSFLRGGKDSLADLAQMAAPGVNLSVLSNKEKPEVCECVGSVVFSRFNPPPGQRRLKGDLVYLEAHTLENTVVHLTAHTTGFYVNKTQGDDFNPGKSGQTSHDLIALLKHASPLFRKRYPQLLSPKVPRHPFEVCPVPETLYPWTADPEPHTGDPNRAEEFLCTAYGADPRGLMRDWNEEYQSCRELPKSTTQERITRDRMLYKVFLDYVDAAQKGAVAVVNKSIPAINPMEEPRAHVFVYNNIFFSYAVDGRDLLKAYGGDKAAHASSNNELLGVQAYDQADVDNLYTLATVVISYGGQRLVAQSIIPGILHGEHVSTHLYGSVDYGSNVAWEAGFHTALCNAGKALHLKEHTVKDEAGNEAKLCSPMECKGIRGSDGRQYILDVLRSTAVDANFAGAEDSVVKVLRPELVKAFVHHKRYELAKAYQTKKKAEKEAKEAKEGKKEEKKEGKEGEEKSRETPPEEEEEEKVDLSQFEVRLNPNALTSYTLGDDAATMAADEALVKEAGLFLTATMIPKVVGELRQLEGLNQEGASLSHYLHAHGINMRYLGQMAESLADAPHVQVAILQEMVVRAAKHIANACLREVTDGVVGPVATHFLNCFLGQVTSPLSSPNTGEHKKNKKGKHGPGNEKSASSVDLSKLLPTLTTATLWQQIHGKVQENYGFSLPEDAQSRCPKLPLLRGVCRSVGFQILRRDYNLDSERPFKSEDVSDLIPVAKYHAPQCQEAREMLDSGRVCLVQGLIDLASPLLNDALSILYQVYGPMHRQTAQCYTHLAILNFNTRHIEDAVALQEKAVVILERCLGKDHPETAAAYEWLAMVLAACGKTAQAAVAFRQGLGLYEILYGRDHLQGAIFQLKACQLLLEAHPEAQLAFLDSSLKVKRSVLGDTHLQTINCEHAVAMANAQRGLFRLAVEGEQKVAATLKEKYGEKDARTAEAEMWLKEFTKRAVAEGKHQKKMLASVGMSEAESKDIMKVSGEGGGGAGRREKKNRNRGKGKKKKAGGDGASGEVQAAD